MYRRLGDKAEPRFDVVRNYLRFYGPARIRDAAVFIDAPPGDVERRWGRPRTSGKRLRLAVEPWRRLKPPERAALEEQAERLAAHRGVTLAGVAYE